MGKYLLLFLLSTFCHAAEVDYISKFSTFEPVSSTPIEMTDGTVVVATISGSVLLFNPDGSFKNRFHVEEFSLYGAPLLLPDDTIVVAGAVRYPNKPRFSYHLFFLNPDGTLKRDLLIREAKYSVSSPKLLSDGTLVVLMDEGVSFLNSDGSVKHFFLVTEPMWNFITIINNDKVLLQSMKGNVFIINPDGTLHHKTYIGDMYSEASILNNDLLAIGASKEENHHINFFDLDGNFNSKIKVETGIFTGPILRRDDGTYVFGSEDTVYFTNHDGTIQSTFKTKSEINAVPALMTDGTVVIGSSDTHVYFFNPDGSKKADYMTSGPIVATARILPDQTIAIGSVSGEIYFLKLSEGKTK